MNYLVNFQPVLMPFSGQFSTGVNTGRVVLPQNIDKKLKEKILLQGSRLPYHFAEAGGLKYVMEKKEVMRKEGIPSPDIIDAMSFPFLEDGENYIVSDEAGKEGKGSAVAESQAKADDEFSDV